VSRSNLLSQIWDSEMFEFSSKMELHMRKNVANRNQGMMQRDNGLVWSKGPNLGGRILWSKDTVNKIKCSECQVNNDDTVIPTRLSMTFVLRMRKVQSEFADLLFRVAKFATWHDEKNRAVENICRSKKLSIFYGQRPNLIAARLASIKRVSLPITDLEYFLSYKNGPH
jgi:hypothetical protein